MSQNNSKNISTIWIYDDIIINKALSDKQFCLYGYLLLKQKDGKLILTPKDRSEIKKIFNYRYYKLSNDNMNDTSLLKDIKELHKQKLIKSITIIKDEEKIEKNLKKPKEKQKEEWEILDWNVTIRYVPPDKEKIEGKFTQLPRQILTKIMKILDDFKIPRYLYYLYKFYNPDEVKKNNGVSNIFVSTRTIRKDIFNGDEKKRIKTNNLLEKLELIHIERQKKNSELNMNNIYTLNIENIINFDESKYTKPKRTRNKKMPVK